MDARTLAKLKKDLASFLDEVAGEGIERCNPSSPRHSPSQPNPAMNLERLFQKLVICSTMFFVGWLSLYWTLESRLPEETRNALAWNGYGAELPMSATVWWFVAVLRVLLAVGLCQFSREARGIFVVVEVFYGVSGLLGGLAVATGTGIFLSYLNNLTEGAVLVLAFTPPLRETPRHWEYAASP